MKGLSSWQQALCTSVTGAARCKKVCTIHVYSPSNVKGYIFMCGESMHVSVQMQMFMGFTLNAFTGSLPACLFGRWQGPSYTSFLFYPTFVGASVSQHVIKMRNGSCSLFSPLEPSSLLPEDVPPCSSQRLPGLSLRPNVKM